MRSLFYTPTAPKVHQPGKYTLSTAILNALQLITTIRMDKPQVFIASSVEGLPVADAINSNLDHDTYPTLWRAGTFRLGSSTIDDLVKKSSAVDFAVFVFTPDDLAQIRESEKHVVRDNVLFELGLFIGALGKERCYIVSPRDTDMHLPSDLLGVTRATYVSGRPDGDIESALNAACKQIKDEIKRHGPISRLTSQQNSDMTRHIANPAEYVLHESDLSVLAECVRSEVANPEGIAFYQISNILRIPDSIISASALKLVRMGYVEKTIQQEGSDSYYVYSITESGIDIFLKNEHLLAPKKATPRKAPNFSDMDDDIPF